MSANPLASKIAAPYARALFDFSVDKNIMHQITADFQNLEIFLDESSELTDYLNNPLVSQDAKGEVLTKTLKSQVNSETFKFLMVLVESRSN
jgi:F-type H+-transporting ATPase subunit delta